MLIRILWVFWAAGKVLGLDNCYGSHKAESVGGVEPI